MNSPLLIFGLGNPGAEYAETYHNAGWHAVFAIENIISKGDKASPKTQKHFSYRKYGEIILATVDPAGGLFMNQSGSAAAEALSFFKLSADRFVLLHDDSDLHVGEWRFEKDRGAAGHHGVESVIDFLQTNSFDRGRIGIRPLKSEGARRLKAEDFVLKRINENDKAVLNEIYGELAKKVIAKV